MKVITVTNLENYQHYKDRNIVWIKLHISMLQDFRINALKDNEKWIFIGLIMLACRCDNNIPYDENYIHKMISHSPKPISGAIDRLHEIGLIDVVNRDPKKPINTEEDAEDIIAEMLNSDTRFVEVKRQYRIENSYIDIFLKDKDGNYSIVEVKRSRLTNKAIKQIIGYGELIKKQILKDVKLSLITTSGFSENFDLDSCVKSNIELYSFDGERLDCHSDVKSPLFDGSIPIRERKEKDKIRERIDIYTSFSLFENDLLTQWNTLCEKCPSLSKILKISSERRFKLKKRFKNKHFVENYAKAIQAIADCPFLLGDNDRKWKVSFDWFIRNDSSYVKILEGFYKDRNYISKNVQEVLKSLEGGENAGKN